MLYSRTAELLSATYARITIRDVERVTLLAHDDRSYADLCGTIDNF